jgi:hypothetical protein
MDSKATGRLLLPSMVQSVQGLELSETDFVAQYHSCLCSRINEKPAEFDKYPYVTRGALARD